MTHPGPVEGLPDFRRNLGSISDNEGFKHPLGLGVPGFFNQAGKCDAGVLYQLKKSPLRMPIDDNKGVSFNISGCPNAFKSHIFLVVKSTRVFKIGKGPDSTVEPDPIPNGKIR